MQVKISDKIRFVVTRENASAVSRVLDQCKYDNPEYYKKMNMGFAVYGTPKEIVTYEISGSLVTLTRGEFLKLSNEFPNDLEIAYEHPEFPVLLNYTNTEFALDDYQQNAVSALTEKRQGIVHAVTSAGKTLIVLAAICATGQRALILVHRKILLEQFLDDIDKYVRRPNGEKITPGIIGDGKCTIGDITVAIDKSFARGMDTYKDQFGTVFLDECHLAPATTLFAICNSINARNKFGLSGTLKRKDQKEFLIHATFGRVIAEIKKDELESIGRVVPVETRIITTETEFDYDEAYERLQDEGNRNPAIAARRAQEDAIAQDEPRQRQVVDLAQGLPGKTIVLSRYVQPCIDMKKIAFEKYGIDAGLIIGKDPKKAMASYKEMKHEDLKLIFATVGCVSTGVSISDLDNIILASPIYNNELLLHQIRGRLMRISPGKTHGTLYFMYDQNIFEDYQLKKFLRILEK